MALDSSEIKSSKTNDIWQSLQLGRCVFDADLNLLWWNETAKHWGFFSEKDIGKNYEHTFAPIVTSRRDLETIKSSFEKLQTDSEQTVEISCELLLLSSQKELFDLFLFRSPTSEVEQYEIILRYSESTDGLSRTYQRLFDSTPDGIMVIDPGRQVRMVNRACGQILGRDPREVVENNCVCGQIVNCHLADGRSLNSQLCPAQDLFGSDGKPQTETMLVTNSEGDERWVETTYSPIVGQKGEVEFVVGLIRDVHDRKILEERLRQSEKLASLGQLTAGIAHEIKNPLGIILSSVEIILDEKRPRDMQVEAASFIRDEVKRLDDRIRGFLKFARPSEPQPSEFDLNEFTEKFFQNREAKDRVGLTTIELAQDLPLVYFDEDHLAQIFTNLYINVFEASNSKAKILVRTKMKDRKVVFKIHDDGPGVKPENRKKIFDPFFTTDASGTGLGLSIVAQLVVANKGRVWVEESKELGGALFIVELPIQQKRK